MKDSIDAILKAERALRQREVKLALLLVAIRAEYREELAWLHDLDDAGFYN